MWGWFWQFDRTRNGNGYAANRITHQDIRALAGERPDEWEIMALLAMDVVRLSEDAGAKENDVPADTIRPGMIGEMVGRK